MNIQPLWAMDGYEDETPMGITPVETPTETPAKKYDHGKPRYDLVPGDALEEIVKVLTYGAEKYADRNWEKGLSYGRVFAAMMRHSWSWLRRENNGVDPETGLSHLAHAGCCIMFLLAFEQRGMTNFDDR